MRGQGGDEERDTGQYQSVLGCHHWWSLLTSEWSAVSVLFGCLGALCSVGCAVWAPHQTGHNLSVNLTAEKIIFTTFYISRRITISDFM